MLQMMFFAEIEKSLHTSIGWNIWISRGVYIINMENYIAVMAGEEAGGLIAAHIIIRVDTADVFVLPLNGYNGNSKL